MRNHVVIWSIAAVTLLCAAAVVVLRQAFFSTVPREPAPEALVSEAITRLAEDQAAWQPETQQAVRAAASVVEEGKVRTAEAYYVLAVQYKRERDLSDAEALFKRAIALRPEWSWPYAGLGTLLGQHTYGRLGEAEQVLRKAIELAPEWGRPHNILAVVLRMQDRLEEAEKEARTALRLAPRDIAAHNNFANLLVELERYGEAEEHYRKAISLNPQHPKPYYNIACLYSIQGQKTHALEYLEQALRKADVLRWDAAHDPDFEPLRDAPRFKELVHGDRQPQPNTGA